MKQFLLSTLNKTINAYIASDPASQEKLKELATHTFGVTIEPMQFDIVCYFSETGINIACLDASQTDTRLSGTPLQLLSLLIAKEDRQRLFTEGVTLTGNIELGMQVMALFDDIHIDWEAHLAPFLGDVPTYHIGRLSRRFKQWLGDTTTRFGQTLSDYLHEEAPYCPPKEALQDFFDDIGDLQMTVDRLEARIKQLQQDAAGHVL
ncbi:MAG TPA: SCP2 sterol-binding domain-containing protein [Gammaproteobacteria bacterium]|jgi:ubiquinone biosynthesis protein UbiJ|nr:SCP2 sterol-binding domain-containing protein [Gammaproteobacteria bacterium]